MGMPRMGLHIGLIRLDQLGCVLDHQEPLAVWGDIVERANPGSGSDFEERACGACDSCALRLRAFREAGIEDPIPYA